MNRVADDPGLRETLIMENAFLIKYGEISLKGNNRPYFENKLVANIRKHLASWRVSVKLKVGRVYVHYEEADAEAVKSELARIFGIISFARTIKTDKNFESLRAAAEVLAGEALSLGAAAGKERVSFKVEARRTDKSFPLSSYEIVCQLGDFLARQFPALSVDVRRPDWTLSVEIRERAYLYGPLQPGLGGLPVGCSGRGLLLLSGGIDSPVAGFLMAKRGLEIDALYFHTPPFTPEQSKEKVIALARALRVFVPGLTLFVANFSEVQVAVKEKAFHKAVTLQSRAAMILIARQVARRERATVLVTGECLGQVASQTPESLAFTESFSDRPILRPLIGMDKNEIIEKAKRIGTFDISTRPFADCCTLFAPEHPLIKPDRETLRAEFLLLGLDPLLEKAVLSVEKIEKV
jgi:thiamine biosynthesis protein ThiI